MDRLYGGSVVALQEESKVFAEALESHGFLQQAANARSAMLTSNRSVTVSAAVTPSRELSESDTLMD